MSSITLAALPQTFPNTLNETFIWYFPLCGGTKETSWSVVTWLSMVHATGDSIVTVEDRVPRSITDIQYKRDMVILHFICIFSLKVCRESVDISNGASPTFSTSPMDLMYVTEDFSTLEELRQYLNKPIVGGGSVKSKTRGPSLSRTWGSHCEVEVFFHLLSCLVCNPKTATSRSASLCFKSSANLRLACTLQSVMLTPSFSTVTCLTNLSHSLSTSSTSSAHRFVSSVFRFSKEEVISAFSLSRYSAMCFSTCCMEDKWPSTYLWPAL